jgi:hypothetical protein
MNLKTIVVEGEKLSGKSTLAAQLGTANTRATVLESRGYFFSPKDQQSLNDYIHVIAQIGSLASHECIIVRGHFFPFAYFESVNERQFNAWDKVFCEPAMHFGVVLLTLRYDLYRKRLDERLRTQGSNVNRIVSENVFDRRRARYIRAAKLSKMPVLQLEASENLGKDISIQVRDWAGWK